MKILKVKNTKQFKNVYYLDNGIIIKIPRYRATGMYYGTKKESESAGIKTKGREKLYFIADKPILNGYIAEEKTDIELQLKGNISINKNNLQEFIEVLKGLLYPNTKEE